MIGRVPGSLPEPTASGQDRNDGGGRGGRTHKLSSGGIGWEWVDLKRISKRSAKGWEPSLPPHTPHPTPPHPTPPHNVTATPHRQTTPGIRGSAGRWARPSSWQGQTDATHCHALPRRGNDALPRANLASHVHLHGPTTRVPTEPSGHHHLPSGGKGHHQRGGGGEGGGTRGPWRVSGGPKTQPGTRRGQIFPLAQANATSFRQ